MFNPSKYQTAIRNWLVNGAGSAIVKAVAGSGKTTLLLWLLEFVNVTKVVLLASFGSKTVKTLADKVAAKLGDIPKHWIIRTFNSIGFQPIKKYLASAYGVGWKQVKLHGCKDWRGVQVPEKTDCILWDMFPKDSENKRPKEYFMYRNYVKRLISLAKNDGIGTSLREDVVQSWEALAIRHNLMLQSPQAKEQRAIEIARDVLKTSNVWATQGKLDFDDQLYLVALWDLPLPKIDLGLIDEYQDTNPIQLFMLGKMAKQDTRFLLVGDDAQSIYGFRGADADAMEKGRDMFNCTELPLSVCYRSSKAVVSKTNEARARVECLKTNREFNLAEWQGDKALVFAADNAPEGKTEILDAYDKTTFVVTDSIICRNVAPLVKLAYRLLKAGVACHVLGKDIGERLLALVDRMGAETVDELLEKTNEYQAREVSSLLDKGRELEAQSIIDNCDCVRMFVDGLKESDRTIDALKANVAKLFEDKNGKLTLSTIHKAKGLEFPRVFILDRELIPSKYAEQTWQLLQEYNLLHVAESRAQLETYYISSDDWSDEIRSSNEKQD